MILPILLVVVMFLVRTFIVRQLTVSTRDLVTLQRIRTVLRVLCADPEQTKAIFTRDRSGIVPGASRRLSKKMYTKKQRKSQ